jgi:transposase-like protein
VLVSTKRDLAATRRFFTQALQHASSPTEVTTDGAPAYPRVLELLPAACHITEQYRNNQIEADHGRLKFRLRPMRGLKRLRYARVISAGLASFKTSTAATTNLAPTSIGGTDTAGLHRTRRRYLSPGPQRPTLYSPRDNATAPQRPPP